MTHMNFHNILCPEMLVYLNKHVIFIHASRTSESKKKKNVRFFGMKPVRMGKSLCERYKHRRKDNYQERVSWLSIQYEWVIWMDTLFL